MLSSLAQAFLAFWKCSYRKFLWNLETRTQAGLFPSKTHESGGLCVQGLLIHPQLPDLTHTCTAGPAQMFSD